MNNWLPEPLPPGLYGVALTTALVSAYFDIRWRKIPNVWVLAGLVAGLAGNFWLRGLPGLGLSLGGLLLAATIYFPLYLLKGMGAGDVKLMVALGAIVGPRQWLLLLVFASIFGGITGLLIAKSKGRLKTTLLNTGRLVRELASLRVPHEKYDQLQLHHPEAIRMPHGVAVAVGTVIFVLVMVLSR
jgi:prepilin peptidase CpaA